ELASNEKKYRELFDYGQSLISLHDLDGIMTKVNPALLSALGYTQDEVVGKSMRDFFPAEHHQQYAGYLREIEHAGISQGYFTVISKGGDRLAWRYHNILVSEPGRRPYVLGHAQDVTKLLAAEKALRNLSLTDDLTKLYNRRGFLTHAQQQIKLEKHSGTARGLNLLFADMDGLKMINDTYGHEAGSDAIIALSNILGSLVRSADLVARWGGDEFVILTIGSTDENAAIMVDRIKGRLAEHNRHSNLPYDISCSIGIATFDPDSSSSIESVIAEADESMYKDKKLRKIAHENAFSPLPIDLNPPSVFK
ncbi:MAG: diguanylate cyclase, partial [Pyrinomonadaceae bacterium]